MQILSEVLKRHFIFFVICIIGIIFRVVFFNHVPPSLNWDEVSHGYNAYSILMTGKDEWGVSYPSIFRAYGDYKLPVYIYSTVISVYFFGLNEFAVRLPSLIAGFLTIIFSYLLSLQLFKKQKEVSKTLALITTFLVAISPWTFFLSRGAFEANFALTFIVSGVYFFLLGNNNPRYFLVSAFLLGLSVWTYNSARVFVPTLLLFMIINYWKKLLLMYKSHSITVVSSLSVLLLLLVPMFLQLIKPVGQARYEKVSIINEGTIYEIEEARNTSTISPLMTRLIHNRPVYFVKESVQNWVHHYTPSFLFFEGGSQFQFSVPNYGLLLPITMPFLLIGIYVLLKRHDRVSHFLLFWFFAGSIASSITSEAPHVLRSVTMLPSPMIIISLGLVEAKAFLERQVGRRIFLLRGGKAIKNHGMYLIVVFLIGIMYTLVPYFRSYFNSYKTNYSWSWQYGYKEIVHFANENYENYDYIITTKKYGEPHEFYLFYNTWNPDDFRNDPHLIRYPQSDWYWIDRFDKYWFVNDWDIPPNGMKLITESKNVIDCTNLRCLLITSPSNAPTSWNKIYQVKFLDGSIAFDIYEN